MKKAKGKLLGWGSSLGLVGVSLVAGVNIVSAQKKVGIICATSGGSVVIREKCLSGETKLSTETLANKGKAGDAGPSGASGASGYQVVSTVLQNQSIAPEGVEFAQACPAGKTTVGGGCYALSPLVVNYRSYPFDATPREWRCGFASRSDSSSANSDIISYAVCVNEP